MLESHLRRCGARAVGLAIAFCLASAPALARTGSAPPSPPPCTGTFSNGASINVKAPQYMPDVGYVKGHALLNNSEQTSCDVHTFAWNQFLYYTHPTGTKPGKGTSAMLAGVPRFLTLAPWYNVLRQDGAAPPGAYPGGPTDLRTAMLDQRQAGDDDHLLDVGGHTVRYDIRFDINMYNSIVLQKLYTEALFTNACKPDPKTFNCANNNIWVTPSGANEHPEPGSIEIKTAWRDFGSPANCPRTQFYCNGRFGLVGFHYVNKTFSHGEWIWATFEHVGNAPDCTPGGDEPIAQTSPTGAAWSFFNPATVPPGVMSSKICGVTKASPQCNTDPVASKVGTKKTYKAVNICRTTAVAAGGASTANCAVSAPGTGPDNTAGNIACLNATIMPQRPGVWKNYKLVGALWVKGSVGSNNNFLVSIFQTQPPAPPPPPPIYPPTGVIHLANTTLETWMQSGSTGYDPFQDNGTQAGCFNCHNMPSSKFEVDLSHFPGKLPKSKMLTLLHSLLPANSTMKAPN